MGNNKETREIEIVINGKKASASIKELDAYVKFLSNQLKKLPADSKEFVEKSKEFKEVKARLQEVKEQAGLLGKAMNDTGKNALSMKAVFTAVMAAISFQEIINQAIQFGKKCLELAATYSDAFADIRKSTGMTAQEVQKLNDQLGTLDTRTSQLDLLGIAKVGGQINVAKEAMASFVENTDKAVVALGDEFDGGAEEVAATMGTLNKLFEETRALDPGEAINKIGSAINELGAAGTATGPVVAEFTKRVGALGNMAPSISQTLGLGAALQELGLSAEVASGGVTNILLKVGEEIPAFAKQLNMSNKELKELLNNDPNEVLLKLAKSLEGASNTKIIDTLQRLKIGTQESIKVVSLLANKTDLVKEKQALANKALEEGTSLTNEFNIKNNTLAAQQEKNAKLIERYQLQIGQGLAPAWGLVLDVIGRLFGLWETGWAALEPTITGFLENLTRLGRALGITADSGSLLSDIFSVLGTVLKFTMIPFKLLLSVLSAVALGLAVAYEKSAFFRFIVQALLAPIKAVIWAFGQAYEYIGKFTAAMDKLFALAGKEVKVKASVENSTTNKTTNTSNGNKPDAGGDPLAALENELTLREEKEKKAQERREAREAATAARKQKQEAKQEETLEKQREDYRQRSLAAQQAIENLKLELIDDRESQKLARLKASHEKELQQLAKLEYDAKHNKALSEKEKTELQALYTEQRLLLEKQYTLDVKAIQDEQAAYQKELQDRILLAEAEQAELDAETDAERFEATMARKQLQLDLEREQVLANERLTQEERAALEAEFTTKAKELTNERTEHRKKKEKEVADQAASVTQTLLNAVGDFTKISTDKKIAQAERAKKAEIAKLDEQLASGLISQDQYQKLKGETEEKYDKQAREAKKKQAKIDKAIAIANAVIATALAVVKALPNIPLSILAGVTGGIGIAKIAATPIPEFADGGPTVKGARNAGTFADGGPVPGASYGIIGERGPEWVAPNWMLNSPQFANVIGWLETQRLGKMRMFADGGLTGRPAAAGAADPMAPLLGRMDMLLYAFTEFSGKIDTWQRQLQVINSLAEVEQGLRMRQEIQEDGMVK